MEPHSEAEGGGQLEKTVAPSLPLHGCRVGWGAGKKAGRIIPLILATELLKLPGLRWAGRLLLVEQSQAVNALLHHSYLRICPQGGERRRAESQHRTKEKRGGGGGIQSKGRGGWGQGQHQTPGQPDWPMAEP